jgi:phage-related protein
MPIGAYPIGGAPIGGKLAPNFAASALTIASPVASASISSQNSASATVTFALRPAALIYAGSALSAAIVTPPLTVVSSVAVTLQATGTAQMPPITGYSIVFEGVFATIGLNFGLAASGQLENVNNLSGGASFALDAIAAAQNVLNLSAAIKIKKLKASCYLGFDGTIASYITLPPILVVSGSTFFGNLFTPPRNPQFPLDIDNKPRIISPQFGLGDPQNRPDGVNAVLKQTTLKFIALSQADFNSIDAFIAANLTAPIYYLLPDESVPRLWTVVGRTRRQMATTWQYEIMLRENVALGSN